MKMLLNVPGFSDYILNVKDKGSFLGRVNYINTKSLISYNGSEYNPKSLFKRKTRSESIYNSCGFRVPDMLASIRNVEKKGGLDDFYSRIKRDFVLKPDLGVGAHGVKFVRYNVEDDMFYESNSNIPFLKEGFVQHFSKWSKYKDWVAEELLLNKGGGDLIDYKFYSFKGFTPLVLARRNNKAYKWFDVDGRSVKTGFYDDHRWDDSINIPDNFKEMLGYASEISASLPFPFCRVDLFNTDKGVVLGELTPQPARPEESFNEYWESLLICFLKSSLNSRERK